MVQQSTTDRKVKGSSPADKEKRRKNNNDSDSKIGQWVAEQNLDEGWVC
jgi:hypothetical protein